MGASDDFMNFLNGVGSGLMEIQKEPWDFANNAVDKTADVVDHGIDGISDIFKNLQTPLLIGGAVILLIMLNK